MARKCSVCAHPRAADVDRALVEGGAHAAIARSFNLGRDSVRRHLKNGHIADVVAAAVEAETAARGDGLLDRLRELEDRSRAILDKSERAGDLRSALGAVRELRSLIELWAKLIGELQPDGATVIVNDPEWVLLRGRILVALDPFPDARAAVVAALEDGER
jgi:hypothetical protein